LDYVATQLVDENKQFVPGWKKVIEKYPDRFIVGVDSNATPKILVDFGKRVGKIRKALGGLKKETAVKVATGNLHRIIKLP